MENKVTLYNSNDIKIGETYLRRARQLVRQQRAMWVDDDQSAVRFAPGMENMDITENAAKELSLYQLCFVPRKDGYYYPAYTIALQPNCATVAFLDGHCGHTPPENVIRIDEAYDTMKFQCKHLWKFWDGELVGHHPVSFRYKVGGTTQPADIKDLRAMHND